MIINMIQTILNFLLGGGLKTITDTLTELRRLRLEAETAARKLELDEAIARLEAQQSLLLAEQSERRTSWVRPAFATIALIFWVKVGVYDTVLGLGTTPDPGPYVMWFMTGVPAAYFALRPFEKMFR